jgi:hypothetical protein
MQKLYLYIYRYFTNKEVLDRIPKVFVLLAGIYVIAQFLGIILIFTHPSDKKVQKAGNKIVCYEFICKGL